MGTQYLIRNIQNGSEGPEWKAIADANEEEATKIFMDSVNQEKEWVDHLFQDGPTKGLNDDILKSYIEYLANQRMPAAGLKSPFKPIPHPLPWINKWLNSDSVQVAPQEVEISSYLISQVDNDLSSEVLDNLSKKYK